MAIVNQVQKKIKMDQWDIVKFQLNMYCYLNKISISDLDLNCISILAIVGEKTIEEFCEICIESGIFNNNKSIRQHIRNILTKAEKKNLIIKKGKSKKKISLNIQNIQTTGNILLDFKVLRIESQES